MRCSGSGGCDLQNAAMNLNVKCQNMAAEIGKHVVVGQ